MFTGAGSQQYWYDDGPTLTASSTKQWDLYGGSYSIETANNFNQAMRQYQTYQWKAARIEYKAIGKAPEITIIPTTLTNNEAAIGSTVYTVNRKSGVNDVPFMAFRDPWTEFGPRREWTDHFVPKNTIFDPQYMHYMTVQLMAGESMCEQTVAGRTLEVTYPYLREIVLKLKAPSMGSLDQQYAPGKDSLNDITKFQNLLMNTDSYLEPALKLIQPQPVQLSDTRAEYPGFHPATAADQDWNANLQIGKKQMYGWYQRPKSSVAAANGDTQIKDYTFKEFARTQFVMQIPEIMAKDVTVYTPLTLNTVTPGQLGTTPTIYNQGMEPFWEYEITKTITCEFTELITTPDLTPLLAPATYGLMKPQSGTVPGENTTDM